jgi:hypothetical protein
VVGAIVLTPLVGVVRVVRAELASDNFPGAVSDTLRVTRAESEREPVEVG